MSRELCRLCLGVDYLKDIFLASSDSKEYSTILALTTGVRIEPNDGLPQQICRPCSNAVNEASKLRDLSLTSETRLIQLGYQRRCVIDNIDNISAPNHRLTNCPNLEKNLSNTENTSAAAESNENGEHSIDSLEEISTDRFDFDGFKIEVELDRMTQGSGDDGLSEAKTEPVQPLTKNSRKETRQLYLSLVEGEFKPEGPVQCKVCKVTVSKWACFTNHVKKHLGFKFVCEYCGASFISSSQLKRHSRSLHGLRRELRCPRPHCAYLALDNVQLQIHDRRAHTGERPYVCAVCGGAYYSRKCLVQHTETHREGATVQCEQCPRLFKSRRHLAKHRYGTHTDNRRARRKRNAAPAAAPAPDENTNDS